MTALGLILTARRRWWIAVAVLTLIGSLQFSNIARNEWPRRSSEIPTQQSPRLRILFANVLHSNLESQPLIELIRREKPDVVGLIELTTRWNAELKGVAEDYPYRIDASTQVGATGLALWLKQEPIASHHAEELVPGAWPVLHASLNFAGQRRELWLMHPSNPTRAMGTTPHYLERESLADAIRGQGGSIVAFGDFNCTDGSLFFDEFLRRTGLRDTRRGFGRHASWPSWSPYRISIDHAFISEDWLVLDRRLGPDIGSDHFPVIIDLVPRLSENQRNRH